MYAIKKQVYAQVYVHLAISDSPVTKVSECLIKTVVVDTNFCNMNALAGLSALDFKNYDFFSNSLIYRVNNMLDKVELYEYSLVE